MFDFPSVLIVAGDTFSILKLMRKVFFVVVLMTGETLRFCELGPFIDDFFDFILSIPWCMTLGTGHGFVMSNQFKFCDFKMVKF